MTGKTCFVIGPIGKDGTTERKHADLLLHAVIKQVLEGEVFGYKVKRSDEDADPGMIGDRVISDIIRADLVVADLTDLNPNAFYELGIRHSTEKPVIHVAKQGTQLPFDNVSHRTIFVDLTDWQSIEQSRSRLAGSARAIADPTFQVSNPITQANASFRMRQSADPRDQVIAELQDRVRVLEQRVPDDNEVRRWFQKIKQMLIIGFRNDKAETEVVQEVNEFLKAQNSSLKVRDLSLSPDGGLVAVSMSQDGRLIPSILLEVRPLTR